MDACPAPVQDPIRKAIICVPVTSVPGAQDRLCSPCSFIYCAVRDRPPPLPEPVQSTRMRVLLPTLLCAALVSAQGYGGYGSGSDDGGSSNSGGDHGGASAGGTGSGDDSATTPTSTSTSSASAATGNPTTLGVTGGKTCPGSVRTCCLPPVRVLRML